MRLGGVWSEQQGDLKSFSFVQEVELRVRFDELSSKIDVLMVSKTAINNATGDSCQRGVEMKRSIDYPDEREIDERITSIEFRLWTDAISLKEEKAYLQRVLELKKRNRPKVFQVNETQDAIENYDLGADFNGEIGRVPRGAVLWCKA